MQEARTKVEYRGCITGCITVCMTKENFVLQYVKQLENEKICLCGWMVSHSTGGEIWKGDFETMSREILLGTYTDKDRKKGRCVWRERFR